MSTSVAWADELQSWLEPFLKLFRHPARRRMCPLYVSGLTGPEQRKSLQPIAAPVSPASYYQLHHFVAVGPWDEAPLEAELLAQANRLVGGADAVLVINNTALPKKGTHSVGVDPKYATAVGKNTNCQTLISLTSPDVRYRSRSACGCFCPTLGSRIGSACTERVCLRRSGRSAPSPRSR